MVAELGFNVEDDLGFNVEENASRKAVIKVIGVGGAGGNAVNHMINRNIKGVECISANTDAQALENSSAHFKIRLGESGLGAGTKPEKGREAAEASREQIRAALNGADMLFITAGMGGGTGTGASPIVAEVARELGILTVGVVTKPFSYEVGRHKRNAEEGIAELSKHVNALIVILNDNIAELVGEDATQLQCLAAADEVLYNACAGISEIVNVAGLINVDFEDVRTIMSFKGQALMGTATVSGENRAEKVAEQAIACPLLEGVNLSAAGGLLVNITGHPDNLSNKEIRTIINIISSQAQVSSDAEAFVHGVVLDESMGDAIRVTVLASGLSAARPEVVVDNTRQEQLATGTDHVSSGPFRSEAARQAFNPFSSPRSGASRLNTGYGMRAPAPRNNFTSSSFGATSSSASESSDVDVPAFLQRQAN
ncbi:cell division protein FtsZ [Brackiella oedipodis]|uniref:cell division protein FtsZ n=1 Tax=Brackiella oedipodis TaxID=124225 RepID=UPI000688619C|nr:cell division protein FtsZ [Brackiella oedipodis]